MFIKRKGANAALGGGDETRGGGFLPGKIRHKKRIMEYSCFDTNMIIKGWMPSQKSVNSESATYSYKKGSRVIFADDADITGLEQGEFNDWFKEKTKGFAEVW